MVKLLLDQIELSLELETTFLSHVEAGPFDLKHSFVLFGVTPIAHLVQLVLNETFFFLQDLQLLLKALNRSSVFLVLRFLFIASLLLMQAKCSSLIASLADHGTCTHPLML